MAINTNGIAHLRIAANTTVAAPDGFVFVGILVVESSTLKGKAIEGDDLFLATDYATGTGVPVYAGQYIDGMYSEIKNGAGLCYAYISKVG